MNNPWINYHHLFYFKTIAEEGSVSLAAKKLRLGQPTLSAQLKQFESVLGVQLFERQHKRLILTEQGKVALDYARNIFKMGSEMYEVLHDRLIPSKISVQIGAIDSIAKQIILQLTKQAYKIAPCQIGLLEGKSDELLRELLAHRIDILVTNFVPGASQAKGLYHRAISKKPVSFYASSEFKGLRKNFPRSLAGQPVILPSYDSRLRYDIDHWSKLHSLNLNVIAESQDIAVKKLMAISGMGLIPSASHTVVRQIASKELIEIGQLEGIHEELLLVSAERRVENPIAARLMQQFKL